jgi:hypothetical protein
MFTYVSRLSGRELIRRHLPTLVVALAIAEVFYKFHSFLLECVAFLATWFVLDYVVDRVLGAATPRQPAPSSAIVRPDDRDRD